MTGQVSKGVHTGDARYFLLPAPSDALVLGTNPDGQTLTKDIVAGWYTDTSHVLQELDEFHFQGGAAREYETGDGKYRVLVRLLRFSTPQGAKSWMADDQPSTAWKAFAVPGYPDVKGHDLPMSGSRMAARTIGCRGDMYFELYLIGKPPVDHAVLFERMHKQITRLDTGS